MSMNIRARKVRARSYGVREEKKKKKKRRERRQGTNPFRAWSGATAIINAVCFSTNFDETLRVHRWKHTSMEPKRPVPAKSMHGRLFWTEKSEEIKSPPASDWLTGATLITGAG
jgi:hypothetical protein